MNFVDKNFKTVEEGIKKLKEAVVIRNKMCGAMYWNMLNDDCIEIAQKLKSMGVEISEINKILNG